MDNKVYAFKDVSGSLNSPIVFVCPSEGEPVSIEFTYFDKEGIAWKVKTQGYRVKTGEVINVD